jgi:hypothetical protein
MSNDEDDVGPRRSMGIHNLSDAELIKLLQLYDGDDEDDPNSLTRMVEDEIARRRKEGGAH